MKRSPHKHAFLHLALAHHRRRSPPLHTSFSPKRLADAFSDRLSSHHEIELLEEELREAESLMQLLIQRNPDHEERIRGRIERMREVLEEKKKKR